MRGQEVPKREKQPIGQKEEGIQNPYKELKMQKEPPSQDFTPTLLYNYE